MPMYDFKCEGGHEFEALAPVGTEHLRCRHAGCSHYADKVWVTNPSNVIGDECDIWQENGFSEMRHFTSKSERLRAIREAGCSEAVRHIGVPGSDKSPHTVSWSAISPETLESARALLERVGGITKSDEQVESEIQDGVDVGEVSVPFAVSADRSISIRIGQLYHGVLDPSVLTKE